MKNILIISILCLQALIFTGVAAADVILSEDFESGLPGNWTLIDSSGMQSSPSGPDGYTWTSLNPGGRSLPNMIGTFMICDSDFSGSSVTYRDYMVTPVINCSGYTGVSLQFSNGFRSYGPSRGRLEIRVGGGAWQILAEYSATLYENTVINLSSYADNQSSVELRWLYYNANWAYWWAIDNVVLTGTMQVADDIAAVSIDNPSGMMFVGSSYAPQATVTNSGTTAQTFDVNLIVRNSVPSEVYNQTVTGISLDPSSSTSVTFTPDFVPSAPDNYTFKAAVVNPDDQNTANDSVLVTRQAIEHYGSGGPDVFGNTWKDNTVPGGPTFGYIDISGTGTVIGNGDDNGFGPFPVGFTFPFYDSAYTQFYVNTNGLITLTVSTGSRFNICPVPGSGQDFWISPFWDDLNVRSADGGNIYYQFFDADVDYLVIQWKNFSVYNSYGDPMDMETILYSDGRVLFQYSHVNDLAGGRGQAATIGIQKNAADGLSYLCNDSPVGNRLSSGLAIGWYPPAINHDISVTSIDFPVAPLVATGTACTASATLQNLGLNSETFETAIEVRNLADVVVFRDTVSLTIASGASAPATFDAWVIGAADGYTFTISSLLAGDENGNNNMLAGAITAIGVVPMPITENFEGSFPPSGWTILDYSGTSTWTTTTDPYRSPTHSAQVSYDWLHNTDDWLVLAPIDMSVGSNITWLYYEEQSQWSTHGLRHSFYASADAYFDPSALTPIAIHTPADHVIPGFSGDAVQFDLSPYAGNDHVWIAYRQENNQGPNTEYWWIDDINIFNTPNTDVGIRTIDSPQGGIVENCDVPVRVSVKNFGLQSQTFDVRVIISGNVLGNVYDNTVAGVILDPNGIQDLIFPDLLQVQSDSYTVTASALLPGDENSSNNVGQGNFYASTIIEHSWDDNQADGSITPYPFSNSMLAVRYTPFDDRFTVTGGNIFVSQYSPDGNGYAEFEWVKFCPDAGGAPDLANAFWTVNNVGTYVVPIVLPIDIPDTLVRNYTGDIWIVAKYWDAADDFLLVGTDTDRPDNNSFFSQESDPPNWQSLPVSDVMMRVVVEYLPCGAPSGCAYIPGDINGNGVANGIDVIYGVGFFKGGLVPPVDCFPVCPAQPNPFYGAGDVNGNCLFNGIDITYFVAYLKGSQPALNYCPACPPAGALASPGGVRPALMPSGEKVIRGTE